MTRVSKICLDILKNAYNHLRTFLYILYKYPTIKTLNYILIVGLLTSFLFNYP